MKIIGDVVNCGSETDDLLPISVKLMNLMITDDEAQSIINNDSTVIDALIEMIKSALATS
jgi:hypothetical protein